MTPRQSFLRTSGAMIASVICVLGMTGCVSLDDVTQLSKVADSAHRAFPAIVADISASCARQNVLLTDIPLAERPPSLAAKDCRPYQDVADHLTKDQDILIDYFDALGKLASNKPPSYDKTIDTNVTAIGALPGLSANTIAASTEAQTLMKLLADEATVGYRRREINSLILKANPAVQELTSDLKKVIVTDYAGILSNEKSTMDIYYQSPMAAATPTERLALVLVQRQYRTDQLALQSKFAATIAYGKAMDSLASLHAKLLAEATRKASMKDMVSDLGPDIANLKGAISQLQTEMN